MAGEEMNNRFRNIKGVKWFRDIINDPSRQFGVEVHKHLNSLKVTLDQIRRTSCNPILSEQKLLLESTEAYLGKLEPVRTLPEAFAATIENGTVIGNSGMIITPDGYLIAETASMTGYTDGRCLTIEHLKKPLNLKFKGHFTGNLLSVANPNGGYGHHLKESFFPMLWFNNICISYINTAVGRNNDRMREFLTGLGISSELLLPSEPLEFLTADQVSFFAPSSYMLFREETIRNAHEVLLKPKEKQAIPTKKIFFVTDVGAYAAKHRLPPNIRDFHAFLTDRGFEGVDPGTLTLNEKIALFSKVKLAVATAADGSAQANNFLGAHFFDLELIAISNLNAFLNYAPANLRISAVSDSPIFSVYPGLCGAYGHCLTLGGVFRNTTYLGEQYPGMRYDFFTKMSSKRSGNFGVAAIPLKEFKLFFDQCNIERTTSRLN